MTWEKWVDLEQIREKSFKKLDKQKSTIIFMDCRNVTSNHAEYDLFEKNPIYKTMADCSFLVLEEMDLSGVIYSAADECSVIFSDTDELCRRFQMGTCGDYVLALFLQQFLQLFWNHYPYIMVKNTIFQHTPENVSRYLDYRKALWHYNALFWMAKESLDKQLYAGMNDEESIIALLREHGLYEKVIENQDFYNGVLLRHKGNDFLGMVASVFAAVKTGTMTEKQKWK